MLQIVTHRQSHLNRNVPQLLCQKDPLERGLLCKQNWDYVTDTQHGTSKAVVTICILDSVLYAAQNTPQAKFAKPHLWDVHSDVWPAGTQQAAGGTDYHERACSVVVTRRRRKIP